MDSGLGGFRFPPDRDVIRELLLTKNANDYFYHQFITELTLLSHDPGEHYGQGIDTNNPVRWFFSKLEDGNRQTPNGGIWMALGNSNDYGDVVEKSFTHSRNPEWHMTEYALKESSMLSTENESDCQ